MKNVCAFSFLDSNQLTHYLIVDPRDRVLKRCPSNVLHNRFFDHRRPGGLHKRHLSARAFFGPDTAMSFLLHWRARLGLFCLWCLLGVHDLCMFGVRQFKLKRGVRRGTQRSLRQGRHR